MDANVMTADETPRFGMMGVEIRLRASAQQTAGAATVLEQTAAPGAGSPPHTVPHDKVLCVLRGQFEVLLGGEAKRLGAGATAFIPAGVVHCFRNVAESASTLLMVVLPGGHEAFLRELAEVSRGGRPDAKEMADVARRHGVELSRTGDQLRAAAATDSAAPSAPTS
jgi:quercetin dioxygenase-like cupin family protein